MVFQMAFSVLLPLPLFPLYPSLPFLPLYLTLVLVFSFVSPQHELYFFFLRRSSHPVWSLTRYLTPVVIWIVGHISKAWMIASTRKRKHMTFVLGALGPLTQDYFFFYLHSFACKCPNLAFLNSGNNTQLCRHSSFSPCSHLLSDVLASSNFWLLQTEQQRTRMGKCLSLNPKAYLLG